MNVIITPEAEGDMESIAAFIAQNHASRALSFLSGLRHQCASLGDMPKRFPLVPRFEDPGIRRCVYRNYLIFYRVTPIQVEVLHILHGAMDYEPILFPRD